MYSTVVLYEYIYMYRDTDKTSAVHAQEAS